MLLSSTDCDKYYLPALPAPIRKYRDILSAPAPQRDKRQQHPLPVITFTGIPPFNINLLLRECRLL